MRNKLNKLLTRRAVSYMLVAFAAIAFYMLLNNLPAIRTFFLWVYNLISPFIWGVAIAYLLNPLVRVFEDKVFIKMKHRRVAHILGVILTIVFVFVVIGLIIGFLVPQLFESVTELVGNLESYFNSAKDFLKDLVAKYPIIDIDVDEVVGSWSTMFGRLMNLVQNNLSNIINYSYKFGTGLFNAFITFVMAVYILFDRNKLVSGIKRVKSALMPEKAAKPFDKFCKKSNRIILNFYGMNLLDSLIIGTLNFILMAIFGMKYSLLISVVVGVTNFIPTFGPIIGAVISALLLVLVNPWHALIFLIFTVVLQILDPYVIKPILFKEGTGLSALEVLVSIIIFGRLAGIFGMLIGVPLFAMITMIADWLLDAAIKKKQAAKQALPQGDEPGDKPDDEPDDGDKPEIEGATQEKKPRRSFRLKK